MCGRYRLSRRKQLVEEYFDSASDLEYWTPRYNIAPTQPIPIIRQNPKEPGRELSLALRRCLVPADGFYEWQKTGKAKQPFCFEINEGELFGFAGIWERWKDPEGNTVETCSILTTTPNAVTSAIHDRMPVILDHDDYDLWLDPGMRDVTAASDLLKPYDAHAMRCYLVSSRINYVVNDDAECSARIELAAAQRRLFA